MQHSSGWIFLTLAAAPTCAYAAHYLTVSEAQRVIFPDAQRYEALATDFDAALLKQISAASATTLDPELLQAWRAVGSTGPLGIVLVYNVIGKHEFITFAVGFEASGSVRSLEILEYREAHGDAVVAKEWRDQFQSTQAGDELRLGKSIQNISGATLSAKHLTEGVTLLGQVALAKGWIQGKSKGTT